MRSKTIVWAYLVILSLGTIMSLYIPKNEVAAKEEIVIPGEAIRLRILANSDSGSDQALKRLVRDKVNENITVWVKDLTSIDEARTLIHSKLPEIQQIAESVVEQQHSDQSVNVKFGKVQFPTKLYGEFLYPAGEYEAILITLGEGKGANWWCVLYPPLCFLDFSSGVAVSQGFDGEKKAQREETKPERKEQREETKPERKDQQVEAKPEQELQISDRKQEDEVSQLEQRNDSDEEPAASSSNVTDIPSVESSKVYAQQEVQEKAEQKESGHKHSKVYAEEDEKPVEVKFFVVEMWKKMFN